METIDIRADMEHPNDVSRRPSSSMEHRPRKKKKKKNRGNKSMNQLSKKDDSYAFYNLNSNQSQQNIAIYNDASTIGGNEEVDSQVYKTDVVQDFIDEPLNSESIDLPKSSYSKRNNNNEI